MKWCSVAGVIPAFYSDFPPSLFLLNDIPCGTVIKRPLQAATAVFRGVTPRFKLGFIGKCNFSFFLAFFFTFNFERVTDSQEVTESTQGNND